MEIAQLQPSEVMSGSSARAPVPTPVTAVLQEAKQVPTVVPAEAGPEAKAPTALVEQVKRISEVLNESAALRRNQLQIAVENDIGRVVVSVTEKDSGELVRQIPAEVVLNVARSIEIYKGLMFNGHA